MLRASATMTNDDNTSIVKNSSTAIANNSITKKNIEKNNDDSSEDGSILENINNSTHVIPTNFTFSNSITFYLFGPFNCADSTFKETQLSYFVRSYSN